MKVYISGKISEMDYNTAFELFERVEPLLKDNGYEVVNPMKLEHNHDKTWSSYMRVDIKALCDCDAIYMLNNWTRSKGAELERTIAKQLGMQIIYQK